MNKTNTTNQDKIIVKVEREAAGSPWSIIYYKLTRRSRKIYTIFMYTNLITDKGVDFNSFKAIF